MTTIRFFAGDLGSEEMRVRCDLTQATAPVEVDYCTGDGWEATQYQCANTRHTTEGLIAIGKVVAAHAVEMLADVFVCDAEEAI